MKLKIADFFINYGRTNRVLEIKASDYQTDAKSFDYVINITDLEIEAEMADKEYTVPPMRAENNLLYQKIAELIPLNNAFVLHAATFDIGGVGVAFAAHSGTGKTTHMLLWQKLLGDKMTIVNGDKPIVRFFDDEPNIPYAYGTPWNGKERFGCNMRTPVKHICFIERSETNYVEKMQPNEIIDLIFNQVYMPKDPMAVVNTMQLINRFINCCSIWKIHCNMDISAAEVAYNTIFDDKK